MAVPYLAPLTVWREGAPAGDAKETFRRQLLEINKAHPFPTNVKTILKSVIYSSEEILADVRAEYDAAVRDTCRVIQVPAGAMEERQSLSWDEAIRKGKECWKWMAWSTVPACAVALAVASETWNEYQQRIVAELPEELGSQSSKGRLVRKQQQITHSNAKEHTP